MLTIVFGQAGSGKTSFILNKIKNDGESAQRSIFIVPEQYSHDAERHLCKVCGNKASLYTEVLSFSRLCSRVFSKKSIPGKALDAGGQILIMTRALNSVLPELKIFKNIRRKPDFAAELVKLYSEMRSSCIMPENLAEISDGTTGIFSDKLRDLAIIFAAYEGNIPDEMYDPNEILDELKKEVRESRLGEKEKIYIDGFTDFTMQEKAVLQEFVMKDADITVCLTCDDIDESGTAFELPAETARYLIRLAGKERRSVNIVEMQGDSRNKSEDLLFFGKNLFSYGNEKFEKQSGNIEIYSLENIVQECEAAAARIIELVRDEGYRWRDFAVAVRGWDEWEVTAENIFADYGVPLQIAKKSDILEKPVMATVFGALEIILNDWDYRSVFKYLKAGMSEIETECIDVIENYVIKWNIHGRNMWTREENWTYNPEGYVQNTTPEQLEVLRCVNETRNRIADKIYRLENSLGENKTAAGKAQALYNFLESINLPEMLERKANTLRAEGKTQLCDEYLQLWEILLKGLEQYSSILGDEETDSESFSSLLKLIISQYEVGTIPVSIDRVFAGDMTRMKRRDIKCLILMGLDEDAVPQISKTSFILSDDERSELAEAGFYLSDTAENRISREMNLIYTSITLPSEHLIMSWNKAKGRGKPSFVITAAEKMFMLEAKKCGEDMKINAQLPCFEFAVSRAYKSPLKKAAEEYFQLSDRWKSKFGNAKYAASIPRGRLSPDIAEKLYNKKINVTASRVDKYYSCRFSYFMQYGLRAKKRSVAGFDAPEAGTFMHYLLENVVGDAERKGGFGRIDREECRNLTRKYVTEYIGSTLNGFSDKTSRFRYLFNRLASDAEVIVLDMAEELAKSDFKPVDFELTFAHDGDLPPATVCDGDTEINVVGIVDRADAWLHNGKIYLRVVDYKTGRKAFSLSDIWYGLGMQMLIYLFVLQKSGDKRYGKEIIPAGVMYAPARDVIMQMPRSATDEEINKERAERLRRSGLFLSDPEIIEAMEHGDSPKYLPVKYKKDGSISSEYIAGLEKFGKLSKHIDETLLRMGKELRKGVIEADPYYRGPQDNACCWCDYFEACHFNEENKEDKIRYLRKLKPQEAWKKITGEDES